MENLILLQEPRQPARYLFSRLNPSHIALILLTCFYYLARFRRTNGPRSWIRELSLFVLPRSILRPTYTITHSMRFTIDKNGNRVSARTVHRLLILSPMWTWRWSLRQARWPSVDRNKLLGSWELSRIRCLSTVSSLLLCWTGQLLTEYIVRFVCLILILTFRIISSTKVYGRAYWGSLGGLPNQRSDIVYFIHIHLGHKSSKVSFRPILDGRPELFLGYEQ